MSLRLNWFETGQGFGEKKKKKKRTKMKKNREILV